MASRVSIGDEIAHYRVVGHLGRGGMGEVWEAEDTNLKRRVALKILPARLADDPALLARFQREAEAVAALNHPNIVTIFSVERSERDGTPSHFLTMELVEGKTLDALLPAGGFELDAFFEIAEQLAAAIAAAHEKGVIHRDLKATNVMATAHGRVKVLDFGLAKFHQDRSGSEATAMPTEHLTSEGVVMGTAAYMSPEQAETKAVDHRTDIFSLGVLLYEMATGRRPFGGDSAAAVTSAILKDTPPRVDGVRPGVPRQLGRIIGQCLEKRPDARFQTARDVHNQLLALHKEISLGKGAATTAVAGGRAAREHVSRPEGRAGAAIAAIALVVLAALVWWTGSLDRRGFGETERAALASANADELLRIAVLPFTTVGPSERAYFAQGMSDEITSRLVAVDGVAVPSRVVVDGSERGSNTLGQVGMELGVDYILDATVRWQTRGDGVAMVRITPQLVDVVDDRNLWSEIYDYDTVEGDLFALETQISEQVLDQIGITLQESQRASPRARGTEIAAAYDAYRRGSEYLVRADELLVEQDLQVALDYFDEAVRLDPNFALAHAKLGLAHAFAYHYYFDRSEQRRQRARDAAERALELAPELPEGRLALGHYYRGGLEYQLALQEYELAARGRPGDSLVVQAIAESHWYMGHVDESVAAYTRATNIDPQRSVLLCNTGGALRMDGEHEMAASYHDRAIAMRPNRGCPYFCLVFIHLHAGNLAAARAVVDQIPPEVAFDETPPINYPLVIVDLIDGRYDDVLERLDSGPAEAYDWQHFYYPKALLRGQTYRFMNRPDAAREAFEEALVDLLEKVEARPGDARYHSSLGLAYAGVGRRDEALAEGLLGVQLLPYSKDKFAGPYRLRDLAQIQAIVGEYDAALDNLRILIEMPSLIHLPEIAGDPTWEPLRDDPRFQALVEK